MKTQYRKKDSNNDFKQRCYSCWKHNTERKTLTMISIRGVTDFGKRKTGMKTVSMISSRGATVVVFLNTAQEEKQ